MGDFAERGLREIINSYKLANTGTLPVGTFIELEIKTQDNPREVFERVFTQAQADPTTFTNARLELSMNIISENVYEKNGKADQTSYIRKIVFGGAKADGPNNAKSTDEYYRKTPLSSPVRINDFIKYSVTLSSEVTGTKFATSPNALIRFKLRTTFDFTHDGHTWRLDLTAVKRGAMNEMTHGNLPMIKKQLNIDTLTIDNFLSKLNYNLIDRYEIEIEYGGASISDASTETPLTPAHITGAARKVFGLINAQYLEQMAYREEIYNIATYIIQPHALHQYKQDGITLKQLVTQAIPITRNKYISDVYPMNGYLLTIKADGERGIVVVENGRVRIMTTSLVEMPASADYKDVGITICDCEIVQLGKAGDIAAKSTKKAPTPITRIRIFDVLVVAGTNVAEQGIESRVANIAKCVDIVSMCITDDQYQVVSARYKVASADTLEADLREIYDAEYDMPIDGIIASKPGDNYKDTLNYKWKPFEMNTIDFLAVRCPDSMLGSIPYINRPDQTIYLLFVGISQQYREQLGIGMLAQYSQMFHHGGNSNSANAYYPIQFSPSFDPLAYIYHADNSLGDLHHKIIELSLIIPEAAGDEIPNPYWKFHRVREDRKMSATYYGNNFRTAELTYLNYIDKFPFEQLYNPAGSYFEANAIGIHAAPNKYKRYIINNVFKNNLYGAKWIIDLASGRGADLYRYKENKVGHVLFIDVDATAISELISRKFTLYSRAKPGHKRGAGQRQPLDLGRIITKDVRGMTIHTLVSDLKTPCDDLVARTYQYGLNAGIVDGMVCNFALHYMCDTIENLRNLLQFIARMLKVGGVFYASVMNGKAIFDLLRNLKHGESWICREADVPKYELRKMYTAGPNDKIAKTGQIIHVRLPFTAELVPEPLCNIENLIAEAARLKLAVEINDSMGSHLPAFAKLDQNIYSQLTDDDKLYIGLFTSISFRKI